MNPRQQPIRERTQTDNKQQTVLASLVADGERARATQDRSPTDELKSDLMTRGKIGSDAISAFDKFAALYKKAKQDNSKPSRSGMGEQNGLSYEQRKEDHATGAEAWASLDRFKHKKADDELLAHTFVDTCAAKGMTLDQIADAVIKVSHEFGNDTGAELLNGIEKVAGFMDSVYKGFMRPAGRGFVNTLKNTKGQVFSPTPAALGNLATGGLGAYGMASSGPGFNTTGDTMQTLGLGAAGFIAGAGSPNAASKNQQRIVARTQAAQKAGKRISPLTQQYLRGVNVQNVGAAPMGAVRGAATFGGIGATADAAQAAITGTERDNTYRNLGLGYGALTGGIAAGTGMGMAAQTGLHGVMAYPVSQSPFAAAAGGKLEGGGQVLQAKAMKRIGDMGEAEMKIRLPEIAKSMGFEDIIDPVSKLPTRERMMNAGDRFVKDYMHQNLSDLGDTINKYTNPMFQAMGYDTSNMTPWQRYSMLGGGAMAGAGALMQNPYMMGAGALGMGYSGMTHPWVQRQFGITMPGSSPWLAPTPTPPAAQPQQ
jgi:hypothetical protein